MGDCYPSGDWEITGDCYLKAKTIYLVMTRWNEARFLRLNTWMLRHTNDVLITHEAFAYFNSWRLRKLLLVYLMRLLMAAFGIQRHVQLKLHNECAFTATTSTTIRCRNTFMRSRRAPRHNKGLKQVTNVMQLSSSIKLFKFVVMFRTKWSTA